MRGRRRAARARRRAQRDLDRPAGRALRGRRLRATRRDRAPPGQPAARRAHPARSRRPRTTRARCGAARSRRSPTATTGACSCWWRSSCRSRCSGWPPGSSRRGHRLAADLRRPRASATWATASTSARGRSGRSPACCCARSRSPPASSPSPRSTACARCSPRSSHALLSPARAPRGARARDARREPRRPHAVGRLLAARAARCFVDEPGHTVRCPSPAPAARGRRSSATAAASRRSSTTPRWTPGRELVKAAAAGAALAIDNERLKADLRARVEELRVSRVRIVEAGDAARRRIERDLHDGAQQQLVSLALELRVLKAQLNGTRPPRPRSTSCPRGSRPRSPSCASSRAASTP